MKITNHPVGSPSITPQAPTQETAPSTQAPAGAGNAPVDSGFVPSPELQRFLDLARSEPEIRADRVKEIAQRLQQGDYLSSTTDNKVAQIMLADQV